MLFQFQFIAIKDDKSILTAKVQNLFRFQTYDSKKHRKKKVFVQRITLYHFFSVNLSHIIHLHYHH